MNEINKNNNKEWLKARLKEADPEFFQREEPNKEIVENMLKLLNHAEQISILFPDYTTIWISKDNKGSLYYSEDKKAWNFNISEKKLINLIKNKLGI